MNFNKIKQKLKLKIKTIYILSQKEKDEIGFLIDKIEDIDKLIEVQYKLDEIIDNLSILTKVLLSKAEAKLISELKFLIQKDLSEKEKEKEILDLEEIEKNLDSLVNVQ